MPADAPPILALAGYVGLASLFGLASAMAFSPIIFLSVWGSNVLGDVVFVAGMVGTGLGAWRLARAGRTAWSLAVGLAGAWITYALSWAITGSAMGDDSFDGDPFSFTLRWGWQGLLFSAVAPWLFARRDIRPARMRVRLPTEEL